MEKEISGMCRLRDKMATDEYWKDKAPSGDELVKTEDESYDTDPREYHRMNQAMKKG